MSLQHTDEALLIDRAKQGDRKAFDELYARHEKKVYGFIRVRVYNDDDVQDIAQKTVDTVWRKMSVYEPTLGNFSNFAISRASHRLLDYYKERKKLREREVLLSELMRRFPNIGQEQESEEVMDRLMPPSGGSVEDAVRRAEEYEDAVRRVFGGSSPPHQLIVFGFCKLLEWKPGEVVDDLSGRSLRELAQMLEDEYLAKTGLPQDRFRPYFARLREKTTGHMGDAALRDYYGDDPEADIAHWWYAVKRRVWSEARREGQGPLFELIQEEVQRRTARKARRDRTDEREQRDE